MAIIDSRLIDPATQQDITENFNRVMREVDAKATQQYVTENFNRVMLEIDDLNYKIECLTTVSGLTLTATGASANTTTITVSPALTTGNSYYANIAGTGNLPTIHTTAANLAAAGYIAWNGSDSFGATAGRKICIVEFNETDGAVKGGIVAAVVGG